MTHCRIRFGVVISGALSLITIPNNALAGGFSSARMGAEHGHVATDHPAAIYFNPAGLALSSGSRVHIEGFLAWRTANYERPVQAIDNIIAPGSAEVGTPSNATAVNAGQANLSHPVVSPFFGATSDLGIPNLGVGIGVYVPFGGITAWGTDDTYTNNELFPGAVDGVQRWTFIEGRMHFAYFTAASAYRFDAIGLSIGVGLNYVRGQATAIQARTSSGTDDVVFGSQVVEGRTLVDTSVQTFSIGAGVSWQATPRLRIGASYQSKPGLGKLAMRGTLTTKLGSAATTETPLELQQTLPDTYRLGGVVSLTRTLKLRVSASYTTWSAFSNQCFLAANDPNRSCAIAANGSIATAAGGRSVLNNIPRNFRDTFGFQLGASWLMSDTLTLMAGALYDGNAVPDETMSASLMDMHKLVFTGGLTLTLIPKKLTLDASLTYATFFARDIAPRQRDVDGRPVATMFPSRQPDGAGMYDQAAGTLTLGVGYAF